MNLFVCLIRPSGAPVEEDVLRRFATFEARRIAFSGVEDHRGSYRVGPGIAMRVATDHRGPTRPSIEPHVSGGRWMAAGIARLDDREAVAALGECPPGARSDVDLVASAIARRGAAVAREITGDFAVVVRNVANGTVIAARDALGVKPLYYRVEEDLIAFASHAAALSEDATDAYDEGYLVDSLVLGYDAGTGRTPYARVRAVPPGHTVSVRAGTTLKPAVDLRRYWSPEEFAPRTDRRSVAPERQREACETFRELFERAVRRALAGSRNTWAELSGGLDSSSIVSVAQTLARDGVVDQGICGAVTLGDHFDDETPYAKAVVEAHGVPSHAILRDRWLWEDDGEPPPCTERPEALYPYYARDRAFLRAARDGGAQVLLNGQGPDHYLSGNLYFFADFLARGRLGTAARELLRWSALGQVSVWRFAREHAIEPLLPTALRRRLAPPSECVPEWLAPSLARRYEIPRRMAWVEALAAPRGLQYAGHIWHSMGHLPATVDRGVVGDGIEVRHPYFDRALVEYCLCLPREMRTQPFARKWVMREAMRGVLPEVVRTRRTKAAISGRVRWSLVRERAKVDALLRDPILAQMGAIEPEPLRRAVDTAVNGDDLLLFGVLRPLSLETWLRARVARRLL